MIVTDEAEPIRQAGPDDADAIVRAIRDIVEPEWYPTLDPRGRSYLDRALTPGAVRDLMANGCRYHVCADADGIVGVVAMRDNRHLLKLFVARRARGSGLGQRLWHASREASMAAGHRGAFTLSAMLAAVPLYRRLGFVVDGAMTDEDGIERIPMRTLD